MIDDEKMEKIFELCELAAEQVLGDEWDDMIDIKLIDRTEFEPLHYQPVPYPHKAVSDEAMEKVLEAELLNLKIASTAMSTGIAIRDHRRRVKKDEEAKKAKRLEKDRGTVG